MTSSAQFRVGVDIGGTFTDIVVMRDDGTIHTKKISSSVGDYAAAIVDGVDENSRLSRELPSTDGRTLRQRPCDSGS